MKSSTKLMIALLLFVAGGLGIMAYKQYQFHQEMVEIVKSDEVKQIIEDKLTQMAPNAFTDKGIIKSYEIDVDSVKHNPMGGTMFSLYVNNDKELYVRVTLGKKLNSDKLKSTGGGYSSKLDELLKGE